MKKIRWGVLGAAKIAVEKVIPAMQGGKYAEVTAIASRTLAKARQAATALGIATAYGSYDELLADRRIDAVYNPLPNHLHVPWSIKALQAAKHVLCEKPIALSSAEAQKLVDAGREYPQFKLMEAFMYRHHPQWVAAMRLVRQGQIGEPKTIQAFFSYFNRDPENVRNRADIGGGGLMDIGCYPISLSRWLFGGEPSRVVATVQYDPDFKTDRLAGGILDFDGRFASFTVGTQLAPYQRVHVIGTAGRVELEIPFNAPPDRPTRIWHQTDTGTQEIVLDPCDQYTIQGDLFSKAILDGADVPTPIEDAVANMRVIEAMVRSTASGGWSAP